MGLVVIGLSAGYVHVAVSVIVVGEPEIVDVDPYGMK
jgi:hypothetical protein